MKKNGFTLAEVLVVIGVLGIISAITIPTLMHSTQEQEFKTGYRKAYSVLSQAFQKANSENSIVPLTYTSVWVGGEQNFAALKSQFSIAKECDSSHLSDCWNTSSGSDKYRNEQSSVPSFIDKSGMAWRLRSLDNSGGLVPTILVDTNGSKAPNKYGQDRFPFYYATTSDNAYANAQSVAGMPIKIIPNIDVNAGNIDAGGTNGTNTCPSYATHPCYYTSWLFK